MDDLLLAIGAFYLGLKYKAPPARVGITVACLGLACIGGLFSGALAHFTHSWVDAALISTIAVALTGLWYTLASRGALSLHHIVLTISFVLGVAGGLIVVAWPPICASTSCIPLL